MSTMIGVSPIAVEKNIPCREPLAQVCEEDVEEREFDALVKLWVDNKISYKTLMKSVPEYELSMLVFILRRLARQLSYH